MELPFKCVPGKCEVHAVLRFLAIENLSVHAQVVTKCVCDKHDA